MTMQAAERRDQMLSELGNREWRLLVGGELGPARDRRVEPVVNPSTGKKIASVPWAGPTDVDAACTAADAAAAERDLTLAHKTAERLDAGYVWINESSTHYCGTPFGGTKESGLGREESLEELISYLEQKVIHVNFGTPSGALERVLTLDER